MKTLIKLTILIFLFSNCNNTEVGCLICEFPSLTDFSPRNLKYMRKFADSWSDFEIVQRTVALIPWRSNITLLDKLKDADLRLWYAML